MAISTSANVQTVSDGESPFYTEDSTSPPNTSQVAANSIAQGAASGLDSDTVSGFQAVSSTVVGPNKLVATDISGKLPLAIIPTGTAAPGVMSYVTGTYTAIKAAPPSGTGLGIATDQGVAGVLYWYTGNASAGDNGWILLGGS